MTTALQKILHLARQIQPPGQIAAFVKDAGAAESKPALRQIFERRQDQGELPAQFLAADFGEQGFRFPLSSEFYWSAWICRSRKVRSG